MGFAEKSKLEFTFRDKTPRNDADKAKWKYIWLFFLPNFAFYFFVSEVG